MMINYIEENENLKKIDKILGNIRKKDNIIILPDKIEKYSVNRTIKISKKLIRILKKREIQRVILSNNVKNSIEITNLLKSNNIDIIDKRDMYKNSIYHIINYETKNKKKNEIELHILINEVNSNMKENIEKWAKEFKRINIVTNHIEKFEKQAEQLYENYGILMTVTNNKKRSLSKAKLILNYDFVNEIINTYNIFDEAKIIDLEGDVKIKKKRFCGNIVKDFKYEDVYQDMKNIEDKFGDRILKYNVWELMQVPNA